MLHVNTLSFYISRPPPEDFWKNLARRSSSHLLALDARSPDAGSLAVGGIAALSLASRRDCTGNMRKADMSHFLDVCACVDWVLHVLIPYLCQCDVHYLLFI